MESIWLKSIKSEDATEEIRYLRERYDGQIDFDAFVAIEIDITKTLHESLNPISLNDILDYCKSLTSSTVTLIPNTVIFSKLLLVNPATSATSERSFSLARRVNTWLRSTTSAERFTSLAILHNHKTITDSLNLRAVANEFVEKS